MKKLNSLATGRFFLYFFILEISILLALVLYFRQSAFLKQYDVSYWKDRFEHSQWALPLSKRDIGDDGIYAYGGYRLMHGASIEETNTNKPPVGIYLIGFSISVFNNPNIVILMVGILALVTFYFLTHNFIKDKTIAVGTVALLAVNSMFFSHLWLPLLDLLQMFLLLLHVLLFIYIFKYKKYAFILAILSGFVLGLFVETKPPLILPIIGISEFSYLIYKRRMKEIICLGVGFGAGVLLPYFRYFMNGNSILDYLRLHKYTAAVYYEGTNQVHRTSMFQSIFLGRFPDVSNGKPVKFSDWSLFVPFIFLGSFVGIFQTLKNRKSDIFLKGFSLFVILTLILYSNISSYPRYLLIILPFVTLFFVLSLQKFLKPVIVYIVLNIIIILSLVNAWVFLIPSPEDNLNRFYYNYNNQLFQDIYEENVSNKKNIGANREDFRKTAMSSLQQAGIRAVKFKELNRSFSSDKRKGQIKARVTYFTQDLGTFSEDKIIDIEKKGQEWKVVWDWDLIVNGFEPGENQFVKTIDVGKRGKILDSSGKVVAEDKSGYLVSINPSKMDPTLEQKMLADIYEFTNVRIGKRGEGAKEAMHNAYTENIIPGSVVPLTTNFTDMTDKEIGILKAYPGLILEEYPVRVYYTYDSDVLQNNTYEECCTKIYSSYSYHGVKGIEKEKDGVLSGESGGTLYLRDKNGNNIRTLIDKEPKNGRDIIR